MLKRPVHILAALSLSLFALAPLAASAQYTGINGQIFFNYSNNTGANTAFSIAAANPDKSESHIVIQGSNDGINFKTDTLGSVSVDGSKLVYVENTGTFGSATTNGTTQYTLKTANANGTIPTVVYTPPVVSTLGYIQIDNPVFSPDGATIFFGQSNNPSGTTDGIWSVPTVGGTATQLLTSTNTSYLSGLAVSSVNSKIYFAKHAGTYPSDTFEIDSANFNGTGVVTVHVVGAGGANNTTLRDVSPDGLKLLYSTPGADSRAQLYTVDTATGTVVTQITNFAPEAVRYGSGSFSPDGTKLIYMRESVSGTTRTNVGAMIVSADGTGTPVAFRTDADGAVWSAAALAAAGTYPTPLVLGATSMQGASGAAPTATPGLPNAGLVRTSLPIALGLIGLMAATVIETARRVRRRA